MSANGVMLFKKDKDIYIYIMSFVIYQALIRDNFKDEKAKRRAKKLACKEPTKAHSFNCRDIRIS